jgi:hypothetical protein
MYDILFSNMYVQVKPLTDKAGKPCKRSNSSRPYPEHPAPGRTTGGQETKKRAEAFTKTTQGGGNSRGNVFMKSSGSKNNKSFKEEK